MLLIKEGYENENSEDLRHSRSGGTQFIRCLKAADVIALEPEHVIAADQQLTRVEVAKGLARNLFFVLRSQISREMLADQLIVSGQNILRGVTVHQS